MMKRLLVVSALDFVTHARDVQLLSVMLITFLYLSFVCMLAILQKHQCN